MTVNDILEKNLKRYVLPRLLDAAPFRTGRLKASLGVKQIDGKVVVGSVNEPYTTGQSINHPGVYGFILDKEHKGFRRGASYYEYGRRKVRRVRVRPNKHKDWFTSITRGRPMRRALRNAAREALPMYLLRIFLFFISDISLTSSQINW